MYLNSLECARRLVSCHLNLKTRRILLEDSGRCHKLFTATLVDCDVRTAKPALLRYVLLEIRKERSPKRLMLRSSRNELDCELVASGAIDVVHKIAPRDHRIAMDLRTDAAGLRELNPFIEETVIVGELSVSTLHVFNHRVVRIEVLMVPRMVGKRGGNRLLSD